MVTDSKDQEEWHVDGFSMNITHLPEQNYIWVNKYPTEYAHQSFKMPKDFNPYKHNIHWLLKEQVLPAHIKTIEPEIVYCFDPYVLHRKPIITEDVFRTFIRVSFTAIEIADCNNTINHKLYTRRC